LNDLNKISLHAGNYSGIVHAPSSKSYLQRAIAIAALCKDESQISGYNPNNDSDTVIEIAKSIGANVNVFNKVIKIKGINNFDLPLCINCNESGLAARMYAGLSLVFNNRVYISGNGSLVCRNMSMIKNSLSQFGKTIKSKNNFLPIEIVGKAKYGQVSIDGQESSQLLTGLLIALPLLNGTSIIKVNNLKSKPYIDITIDILKQFGISIINNDYKSFIIEGNQQIMPINYEVEGDWSNMAFHLVGAAISGEITIKNLNFQSKQGDKTIINVLKNCGANVSIKDDSISVVKNKLEAFNFDASDYPDLFPPLVVLASQCKGISKVIGVDRLISKESNRALTLQTEFKKLGLNILINDNTMIIEGGKIKGARVNSHNDHRIAMALSIMSLVAENNIELINPKAVNKSYPNFFNDFEMLKRKKQ